MINICETRFGLVGMLATMLAGCGGGVEGPALAPVKGIVTLDGKPIDGASVIFSPKGEGTVSMAATDLNGKFEMKTGSGRPGAVVGDHGVAVQLSITAGGTQPQGTPDGLAPPLPSELQSGQTIAKPVPPRTTWVIPEKYSKPETSGITVTVPSGGLADYKIELKK